jgi:transposase-like protein
MNQEVERRGEGGHYSDAFRARVVQQCKATGASVSAVARSHQVGVGLVYGWLRKAGSSDQNRLAVVSSARAVRSRSKKVIDAQFVELSMPDPAPESIRLEVNRGTTRMSIAWPVSAADSAAGWLRDVLR